MADIKKGLLRERGEREGERESRTEKTELGPSVVKLFWI